MRYVTQSGITTHNHFNFFNYKELRYKNKTYSLSVVSRLVQIPFYVFLRMFLNSSTGHQSVMVPHVIGLHHCQKGNKIKAFFSHY